MAPEGIWCPNRAVLPGGPVDECREDFWNGVPYLSHRRLELRHGLHAEIDGGGANILDPPDTASPVTGMSGRT